MDQIIASGTCFRVSGPATQAHTNSSVVKTRAPAISALDTEVHRAGCSALQSISNNLRRILLSAGCSALHCLCARGKEITLDAPSLASNRTSHLSQNLLRTSRNQSCHHDTQTSRAAAFPIALCQWTRIATTKCQSWRRGKFAKLQTVETKAGEECGQARGQREEEAEGCDGKADSKI